MGCAYKEVEARLSLLGFNSLGQLVYVQLRVLSRIGDIYERREQAKGTGMAKEHIARFDSPCAETLCSLCGFEGEFIRFHPDSSLRETRCPQCASARRTRDVARVLLRLVNASTERPLCEQLSAFEDVHIFELQAAGPLHLLLKDLPHYHCSEFFPAIPPGHRNEEGILCQDATCLTFPDMTFDIVISQDIAEHIDDTWRAFSEINRVLTKDGAHVFTVPVNEGALTRKRCGRDSFQATQTQDGGKERDRQSGQGEQTGQDRQTGQTGQAGQAGLGGQSEQGRPNERDGHALPPIYHGDPLNPEGAFVWWDFGDDLPQRLAQIGITASLASQAIFYGPQEICKTLTTEDHQRYLALRAQKQLSRFFLYNALVFMAKRGDTPASK